MSWKPTASIHNLKIRAQILAKIRAFFAERNVLEVETPVLSFAAATDPYIQSLSTQCIQEGFSQEKKLYLQTSPEFAMKRLLASGSGAIYQLCKSFRDGESGRIHNPEFTMLEWYRPGFNHHDLMTEMDEFLQSVVETPPAKRISYIQLFMEYLKIDPHNASISELKQCASEAHVHVGDSFDAEDRDSWLFLLLSHCIEPYLGKECPTFIYDFPATQAGLARIRNGEPKIAERFEVYINGIELANGFHELSNADEQRTRFLNDLKKRRRHHLQEVPIDENLLAALTHGLPDCAGVALGVDRLIMLAAKSKHIQEIIAFPFERA